MHIAYDLLSRRNLYFVSPCLAYFEPCKKQILHCSSSKKQREGKSFLALVQSYEKSKQRVTMLCHMFVSQKLYTTSEFVPSSNNASAIQTLIWLYWNKLKNNACKASSQKKKKTIRTDNCSFLKKSLNT